MTDAPTGIRLRRRLFQFGVRTMLVLVTVFAVLFGYSANWIHQRHAVLGVPGVTGLIGEEVAIRNVATPAGAGSPVNVVISPLLAPWPLCWLGERGYVVVVLAEGASDAELERAAALFPEAQVERQ